MPKITYLDCLRRSALHDEFVENFVRLTGQKLGEAARLSPIERMIDEVTQFDELLSPREDAAFRTFALFVKDIVWDRLPPEQRNLDCWVPAGQYAGPVPVSPPAPG